jgi:hypothetical protein
VNLNVPAIPNIEDNDNGGGDFPQKDFRQDFMYSMVKFGLLDNEAPSSMLGIPVEEISGLMEAKDAMEETAEMMDEEGAVERLLGRLDGNQGIVVSTILEVFQSFLGYVNFSLCKRGFHQIIFIHCRCYVLG